ncbi:hypothetical protein [Actinocorallia populi]|uniref:hypothetical protein n=1 Tax=Actinocorallia populi TaxID=2079200 RepID=UPI000D097959|nr:hypothetical protein [Actinocorallia populi]
MLRHLGYGLDPLSSPLDYPGRIPAEPAVLLLETAVLPIIPAAQDIEHWPTTDIHGEHQPLGKVLQNVEAAPIESRVPVAAVGSNASPSQVARKFASAGLTPVVPITAVTIKGIAAGLSAHISKPGYVPAAPVSAPGIDSAMHLTWLDDAEVAVMDATEPNYRRTRLPAEHCVTLPNGQTVNDVWIYVSRHGYIADPDGTPRKLTNQRAVLTYMISRLPNVGVSTPEEWINAAKDPAWRDDIRERFFASGLGHHQPDLALWGT